MLWRVPVSHRFWVVACAAASVIGCGAAPPAAAPPVAPVAAPTNPPHPVAAVEEPSPARLPPPSADLLLPTADGVVVFEVERMHRFDIGALARAFVLGVVEIDLVEMEKRCDIAPLDVIRRVVVSGSISDGVLAAIEPQNLTSATLMECFALAFPEAQARELAGHPVLELGHERLWVTERNGAVLMAHREALLEALGGEPTEPVPAMIDGVPVTQPRLGDVNDALVLLSRDPDRLVAVGHRGGRRGFLALPTLSITFTFDGEAVGVEGDIDLSDEPGPEDLDRIKRKLRREIVREMEKLAEGSADAEPLLRAVDEAQLEQRDRHLIFSGRTAAVDALAKLVNGVAQREIERELERRDFESTETSPPSGIPVEAVAEPVDVSPGR